MFKAAIGHSAEPESSQAIADVLSQCRATLGDSTPMAGLLFAAIDFDHALVLRQVLQVFPELALIGGTTDGEMSSVLGFAQSSLALMLFCSDRIRITAGIGTQLSADVETATQTAVTQAQIAHTDAIQLCLTLPESLTASAVEIVKSLQHALGTQASIFGGLTADRGRFQQSYQFCGDRVYSDAVPVLLFSGPIVFSHGVTSGWQPIGRQARVTRAQGNVVYEIDDQPALDFYYHYFGGVQPSSEYPLAVIESLQDIAYIRAPRGRCDPGSGSIHFFGDVPQGSMVQLTEASQHKILQASQASSQKALHHYPGDTPAAALLFSCASRRKILGRHAREEYQWVQEILTEALPSFGFYANGEVAPPLGPSPAACFHNETFITLLLGEA